MKLVSVDVETANADMASMCQIGVERYSRSVQTEVAVEVIITFSLWGRANDKDQICHANASDDYGTRGRHASGSSY